MKKSIMIIIALMISVVLLMASASADTFTIRNGISFGMSKEEVKRAEELKTDKEGGSGSFISYKGAELAGIRNSTLEYKFEKGKLVEVDMDFIKDATKNSLRNEYKELNVALEEKYGKPLGNKNSKTADLVSDYLSLQIQLVDLDKMLGGKSGFDIQYEEWIVDDDNGKVKIEHILTTGNDKSVNSHFLLYRYFDGSIKKDI